MLDTYHPGPVVTLHVSCEEVTQYIKAVQRDLETGLNITITPIEYDEGDYT